MSARSLVEGDRFIFAEEFGGEGQVLTVESVSCAFGTVSVMTEELDYAMDFTDKAMVTRVLPVEEVGVGVPTPTPDTSPVDQTEEIELVISLRVPKALYPRSRERMVMALTTYAADLPYVIEAGYEEVPPQHSISDLRFLQNEVQLGADVVLGIDNADHLWCKFTCMEIEAVADIFRAADRHDAAVYITEQHAECDEPDDHHYKEDHDDQS